MGSLNNADSDTERSMLFLEREIVVMKLVDHPNIMHLYDVWETSGELYLILEYVEGGELFDYIADRKRLSPEGALDLFQQLISAMDYLQSLKIAHRDLKPENLLLDKSKILKVAVFGMAAWLGGDDLQQTACGSPHYASPEVIANVPYDGTVSDIWSCGVILYALLTGRLPFDDEDTTALLRKVTAGVYVMPTDIDTGAKDLLKKMLEKDVSKRVKIQDIKKHPWFLSQPRKLPDYPTPSFNEIARPLKKSSEIDPDVFANLRTLWKNAPEEELMKSLLCEDQTWEKMVYALLLRYRVRCQENYQEELEKSRAQRRSERKRLRTQQEAAESPTVIRPTTPQTNPSRPAPPTPNRAVHRGGPRPPTKPISKQGHTPQTNYSQYPTTPSKRAAVSPIPPTSPASPIWKALDVAPPMDVPELQDKKVQTYFQQINDQLNLMQHLPGFFTPNSATKTPTPGSTQSERSSRLPAALLSRVMNAQVTPRGLGITDSTSGQNKENGAVLTKKSSLRKAKEAADRSALQERRVQIVLPPVVDRVRRRVSGASEFSDCPEVSLSEASSFSISSAPRKSWFTNLFKFKPATLTIPSMLDEAASRSACRRLLSNAGINVTTMHADDSRATFLQCKLDEVRDPAGVMSITKAVKFRVEFHALDTRGAAEPCYQVVIEIILEKGALSSFRLIHQRVRNEWDFVEDTPVTPVTPQPRMSFAGDAFPVGDAY